MAGNTPLRRWKREVHEGGIADPCIVHCPRRITAHAGRDPRSVRARDRRRADDPRAHRRRVADRRSTASTQRPLEGTSFAYTFDAPDAPEQHTTQYFEMLGSPRDLRRRLEGRHVQADRPRCTRDEDPDKPFDDDVWELFHVSEDFSEVQQPRRRGAREAAGAHRPVVAAGRAVPGAAARQPARHGDHGTAADRSPRAQPVRVPASAAWSPRPCAST